MSGGMHPIGITRVIRIASGAGTRKRRAYKKRTGTGPIIRRPIIRIGVGVCRRKPRTTTHRIVRAGAYQLTSTRRGTGRKRTGAHRVRRARVILV